MRLRNILLFLVLYAICTSAARAQDSSLYFKLHSLPDKLFSRISAKSKDVEQKLIRQTEKYLTRLAKQEKKLQKQLWKRDPSKMEAQLLRFANKIPAFKDFFSKHSTLASMFRLPGNNPVASAASIPGLQTRASILQDMLQRFGSGLR